MAPAVAADISRLLQDGVALHQAGRLSEARAAYRQVLALDPANADAFNLLGVLYGEQERFREAIECVGKAVTLRPGEAQFRNNLGNTYLLAKEPTFAIEHLKEATRLQPRYVEAWFNLGKAHEALDQIAEARTAIDRALRLDPGNRRARLGRAQLDIRSGRPESAVKVFRDHLRDTPGDVPAIAGLLLATKVGPQTPELKVAEQILASGAAGPTGPFLSLLKHAVGKAYDDLGRYDEAIRLIIEGKSLERQPTDLERRLEWGARVRALFTRDFFAERSGYGLPTDKPVFIVGMPRSGTTLIEQIIASHPKAYGAGELPHLSRIASILGATSKTIEFDATKVAAQTADDVRRVAEGYLERLTEGAGKAIRVTDKAPLNVRYLGIVALMFPNCQVIHCRRNPIDTCVSIFMQKFSRGHAYSHNLESLARYYREYVRLADHWRAVLPLKMLDVDYEESVADTEAQARKVIDFLGLKWDDACLSFQHTKRAVATASQWQVRQPVYTTSVERWRRYEAHIGPLIEGLKDLVQNGPASRP